MQSRVDKKLESSVKVWSVKVYSVKLEIFCTTILMRIIANNNVQFKEIVC